ncbi:MAG: endonuclease domain-containing protein [Actinomycetota bacterium]|nr:endonuclease domain-containing protein [Actinomycetota bacterium]
MAQGNWLRPAALQGALDRGTHRRGWTAARVAVRESMTNPHSEAERMTHRALLAAGISDWRANVELVILGRTFRPDLVFDDVKLIVEIDGFAYHSGRDAFERDRQRQNLLTGAGWTVLRFTWRQVYDNPAEVVTQIERTRRMLRGRSRFD